MPQKWNKQTLNIGGGGWGATNLGYTASPTNGIVTSDTWTDATIPLGNGTNAGLSLNDYTTAEKNKLSSVSITYKWIAEVDFWAVTQESDVARVTVNDTNITTTAYPSVSPYAVTTTDHDPDDYSVELITATIANVVNGVSFDIVAVAPNLTWWKYKFVYQY